MARFYFNFWQGRSYTVDDAGCAFETVEDAYLATIEAAREMWSDLLSRREDPRKCSFEVTDEKGHELFTLPFAEVLDACAPNQPTHPPAINEIEHARRIHDAAREITNRADDAKDRLRETKRLIDRTD